MFLTKANRLTSNHSYIIGVYKNEAIAHFHGYRHCKFERAGKYYHVVEELPCWLESVFIESWENDDQSLTYNIYENKDQCKRFKEPNYLINRVLINNENNYRYEAKEYKPTDNDISDIDLEDCANYWHFFTGKALLGLSQLYEKYKERKRKEFADKQKEKE